MIIYKIETPDGMSYSFPTREEANAFETGFKSAIAQYSVMENGVKRIGYQGTDIQGIYLTIQEYTPKTYVAESREVK